MTEIGAFEAKTHFSKLIERAKKGEEFTITLRGEAVARLVPIRQGHDVAQARAALARLRERATRQPGHGDIAAAEIKSWIEDGRM